MSLQLLSHPNYHRPRRRWTIYISILLWLVIASLLKQDRMGIIVILLIWWWYLWYIMYYDHSIPAQTSPQYLELWSTRLDRDNIRYVAIEMDPVNKSFLALYIYIVDEKRCDIYGFDQDEGHENIDAWIHELSTYTQIRDSFSLDTYQRLRRMCRI